jgi:hypothetical protein
VLTLASLKSSVAWADCAANDVLVLAVAWSATADPTCAAVPIESRAIATSVASVGHAARDVSKSAGCTIGCTYKAARLRTGLYIRRRLE